jgi:G3E family GTPase
VRGLCCCIEDIKERELTDIDRDDRKIVNLLMDQVEFANIIILNKTYLATTQTLGLLEAESSAGWQKELAGEHTPETEEYGISYFGFRSHKTFHPERLWRYLNHD